MTIQTLAAVASVAVFLVPVLAVLMGDWPTDTSMAVVKETRIELDADSVEFRYFDADPYA